MGSPGSDGPLDARSTPVCAMCGHRRRGPSSLHHMTHGVTVWLCDAHGSAEFQRRHRGTDFVERLATVWEAAGALTVRRFRALEGHVRRVCDVLADRDQPGSYSWPELRREAERRFAAGEPPGAVIADLRHRYGNGPARVPSERTMRRWFAQARWLGAPAVPHTTRPRIRIPRMAPDSPWREFITRALTGTPYVSNEILARLQPP